MKNNIKTVIYFLLISTLVVSCKELSFNDTKGATVVAQVGKKKLLMKDIVGLNGYGLTKEDSVEIIATFTDAWIKKQVLIKYSIERYKDKKKDVETLIEEYKSLLYSEYFEREYVKGVNDNVSDEEISNYYEENKSKFLLPAPLVKAKLMTADATYSDIEFLKKKFLSSAKEDYEDAVAIAERDKILIKDNSSEWIYFNDLLGYIPFDENINTFLSEGKRVYTTKDGKFIYILSIKDYKLKGDIMPKPLVSDLIKRSILTERKRIKLDHVKDSIYKFQIDNGEIEVKKQI